LSALQDAFINAFLSPTYPFRESVAYTPSGGTAKVIYGVVRRGGLTKGKGKEGMAPAYDYELLVSNDSTSGIATVTAGEDTVLMSAYEFGAAETNTFTVAGIMGHSQMGWHLGLRP